MVFKGEAKREGGMRVEEEGGGEGGGGCGERK